MAFLRKLFASGQKIPNSIDTAKRATSLRLEQLEDRTTPADIFSSPGAVVDPFTGLPKSIVSTNLIQLHSEYTAWAALPGPQPAFVPSISYQDVDAAGRVFVRITAQAIHQPFLNNLKQHYGYEMTTTDPSRYLTNGWLPITSLPSLAQNGPSIGVYGVLVSPKPFLKAGVVLSQGDAGMDANLVRAQLPAGIDGTGVTVGVLSDSYNRSKTAGTTAAQDIASKDLPAAGVQILQEGPAGSSDEGRAMLQIIHDLAPGANLAFATASGGQTNFAKNIVGLANKGATVLVDDIGYFTDPFYQDSEMSVAVDQVTAGGKVTYYSAAGNDASQAYEATGLDASRFSMQTIMINGVSTTGMFFDFDPGPGQDFLQNLTVNGAGTVALNWDDPYFTTNGVFNDLDIFLLKADAKGTLLNPGSSSTDANITNRTPQELIDYFTLGPTAARLVIRLTQQKAGASLERLKYIDFGGGFVNVEYNPNGAPTIYGQPGAKGAIAVGAVPYFDLTTPEDFTSRGPVTILFDPLGNRLPTPEIRNKPEVAGTDAVATTMKTFSPFFGTSAAAPHVSAISALIQQANPSFTTTQVYQRLIDTAMPIPGKTDLLGAGLVQGYEAVFGKAANTFPNYINDFESGPNSLVGIAPGNAVRFVSTGAGRISVISEAGAADGMKAVFMDAALDTTSGKRNGLNEMILNFDTTGASFLELSFSQNGYNETINAMPVSFTGSSNSDGVAYSVDGNNWFRVIDSKSLVTTGGFTKFTVDMVAAATMAGGPSPLNVPSLFIKFQQFGNGSSLPVKAPFMFPSPGTGGIAYDGISVRGGRDVTGKAYNDINGNGIFDAGEPPLSGVTVYFDSNNNGVRDANEIFTVTDMSGAYKITALSLAPQPLRVDTPADFTVTGPVGGSYSISGGNQPLLPDQDFGLFQLYDISGTVFSDINSNGILDVGEPGLPGFTVRLLDSSSKVVATTVTATDGTYIFTDIGPGEFRLDIIPQPTSFATSPPPPPIIGGSGVDVTEQNFGQFVLGTISGVKYNDLNGDGIRQLNEPGVGATTILLFNQAGILLATTTTSADGTYSFTNLDPGIYRVREITPDGFEQTSPDLPDINLTLSGTVSLGNDFGNFQFFSIAGIKFLDENGNGVLDPGELGQPGVTINLFNQAGQILKSTTTNADGSFQFTGLRAGVYTVAEVIPGGFVPSTPGVPPIVGVSGAVIDNVRIGNFGAFAITGLVFRDLNGDGFANGESPGVAPEPGLAGVTVRLLRDGLLIATTVSNAQGVYAFSNLRPGTYTVIAVPPAGFTQTSINPQPIPSVSGQIVTGVNFGFQATSVPAPIQLLAVGADAGGAPRVQVFNSDGSVRGDFFAYDSSVRGGVRVAVADVNGDGVPDIITVPAAGGGPHIRVFDGNTFQLIGEFFPFDPNFRGGAFVGAGDIDGDGIAEIIASPDINGGPIVGAYRLDGSTVRLFYAFDENFRGGVRVAGADVNNDGRADFITAPASGGGPIMRVFSGFDLSELMQKTAYDINFRGGLFVAGGDLDRDGFADVVIGPGNGYAPQVFVFSGRTGEQLADLFVSDPFLPGAIAVGGMARGTGVRVAVTDVDGDGVPEVVTGLGPANRGKVRAYSIFPDLREVKTFAAFEDSFADGIYVGGNS